MATTQVELAQQLIAQLRVLDPSVSAEIGTPERKMIDTFAQALAENQVDLNILSGGLDIDSKFGADLDRFLGIFSFGRQQATRATGFVTFSRTTTSTLDISIPRGTQVNGTSAGGNNGLPETANVAFRTTESVTLLAGTLSVIAPIECIVTGSLGNVAANTITNFGSSTILGITGVTNIVPTTSGLDAETDDQFKTRFKNTVFRNVSGTEDQYLAIAVSTAFTTKASAVGPISRYREYVQVPAVDDASADPSSGISGNGTANQWTSALSTIPFSKHIYDTVPYFVSNGQFGGAGFFYRQDADYALNTTNAGRDRGDAYRERIEGTGKNVNTDTTTTFQPNLTFFNVYAGTDPDVVALRPKNVVLFEHSYMSSASRNDMTRQITNCVDVFINGQNSQPATAIIPAPGPGENIFVANATDRFYYENFRRIGEPQHRPIQGNLLTPLFWEPVLDVPDQIVTNSNTYIKGVHYWVVEDVSTIRGTVRCRNGIEWSTGINGMADGDGLSGPYTGSKITAWAGSAVEIDNYLYDQNIVDLQTAMEGAKQTTTDPLAHAATKRYFKLDVTVMYNAGASVTAANLAIQDAVSTFFDGQYFGTTIQLSDLLQAIHNAAGIDNVRWSKEILDAQSLTADSAGRPRNRVVECDVNGNPLLNVILERVTAGTVISPEVWQYYFTGTPTGGTYTITYGANTTAAISSTASTTAINSALSAASIPVTVVSGAGTSASPYLLDFSATGFQTTAFTVDASDLLGGGTLNNSDFYLQDSELPSLPTGVLATDTLAGLIIRPRAQNTWNQL